MRRECRQRFPRHRFQRKLLVSGPGIHHGTCVTHVPWCMSGSLTRGGRGNIKGIPGACAIRSFAYLVRGPWSCNSQHPCHTNESIPRIYKFVQPMVWQGFWLLSQLLRLATFLLFGIMLRIYRLRFTFSFMIVWANVRFSHFSRVYFLHFAYLQM